MSRLLCLLLACLTTVSCAAFAVAGDESAVGSPSHQATAKIHEYLRRRVIRLNATEPAGKLTADQWQAARPQLQQKLFDMLGLWPLPDRSPLEAIVTGQVEQVGVVVEKLVFQSRPGLYVTANFYRPAHVTERLPAVLYLNGHAKAVEDGVSLGNKVSYQHHGGWLAQNGFCCLSIDTLQLGEVPGEHHGTYHLGQAWWVAKGYTPAGVEAWNAIRALDYLESRSEVDAQRIGVTGRSGGGAYTWWLAALDDRPICVAPVAGITDLENHVVDDCIQGHCDCMYHLNYAGWDFATVAALTAPRPCLLANTDADRIFPLNGVMRLHEKLRAVYRHWGAEEKLGVFISPGPHVDSQELQLAVFRWLNRYLRNEIGPIQVTGEKQFPPAALKVLTALPLDQRNETAPEWFVASAQFTEPPATLTHWNQEREALLKQLQDRCFQGIDAEQPLETRWVAEHRFTIIHGEDSPPDAAPQGRPSRPDRPKIVDVPCRLRALEFLSEDNLRWTMFVMSRADEQPVQSIELEVLDDAGWGDWLSRHLSQCEKMLRPHVDATRGLPALSHRHWSLEPNQVRAVLAPRGWGLHAWSLEEKVQTHMPRKFVLAGTTVDEGRVWDVRRAVQSLREQVSSTASVTLRGRGAAAGIALYAGLLEPAVGHLELEQLPSSHRAGPCLMGVLRVLDLPQAVALCFPRSVTLYDTSADDWRWTQAVANLYRSPPLRIEPKSP